MISVDINNFPLVDELWTTDKKLPAGDHARRLAWLKACDPTNTCRIVKTWRSPGTGGVIYVEFKMLEYGGGYKEPNEKHMTVAKFLESWVRV